MHGDRKRRIGTTKSVAHVPKNRSLERKTNRENRFSKNNRIEKKIEYFVIKSYFHRQQRDVYPWIATNSDVTFFLGVLILICVWKGFVSGGGTGE